MLVHFLALTGAPVSTRHTYTSNQRTVTAHFSSEQLLSLGFVEPCSSTSHLYDQKVMLLYYNSDPANSRILSIKAQN